MRRLDLHLRSSLRGTKRCPSCNELNWQRSQICANEACELRGKMLAAIRPFDPVQLVTHNDSALYSVRLNNKGTAQPRNFVQITEVTLALEPHSAIVSRNAICFVDTCKYDASEATGIACKHIKACTAADTVKPRSMRQQLPKAEVYSVSREVLWNLNIDTDQKERLWRMYKDGEELVPAVQRLSDATFAVQCVQTKVFPAGRLHVTAMSNDLQTKKSTHACACKKLKIILEPDNSVVMQEEICDHLLLVLAAILSQPNGKTIYSNFTGALKSYWMPAALDMPVVDMAAQDDAFFGMNINIGGDFVATSSDKACVDDIFVFGDDFLAADHIPEFSDIIFELTSPPLQSITTATPTFGNATAPNSAALTASTVATTPTTTAMVTDLSHVSDPNLVSSCNIMEEDVDGFHFRDLGMEASIAAMNGTPSIAMHTTMEVAGTHQLSDCNIELMDQYQLTDQIDMCSDDISLPIAPATLLDNGNAVSIIPPFLLTQQSAAHSVYANSASLHKCNSSVTPEPNPISDEQQQLPTIELPTIEVTKKCELKASQVVTAVKTRKFPPLPAKRAFIVNASPSQNQLVGGVEVTNGPIDAATEPALAYSAWLDHIIETINESIVVDAQTEVKHSFHVHEEIFAHFSKSFSIGVKRRIPNSTTMVKSGKYKGLIKYSWYFYVASTARRIFSTANISLEMERYFERCKDGGYVRYVRPAIEASSNDKRHRRIYTKIALTKAYIWFDCNDGHHKTGLHLEWVPNAFPRSRFGILNLSFSLGIKEPEHI